MIQPIRLYGDPVLRCKCDDVTEITEKEQIILTDMWDTMIENKCVGLSAPQIGVTKRLFVIHTGGVDIKGANPEILSEGALTEDIEGSPCTPGISRPIRRPKKIICRYLSEENTIVETELKGVAARAFCHEKDHHDGIMFFDHLKPAALKLIQKDLERISSQMLISRERK